MNCCSNCGQPVHLAIPSGDNKLRYVCSGCKTVHYENPRMIVGCLPRWEDQVLLCKRSTEPRRGTWTLPAGFLENGESVEAGAQRETLEEANAEVNMVRLLSLYSVPAIGQVYLFFLADLKNRSFHPGAETERTTLFRESEIPWDELSFPSVRFTLEQYFRYSGSPSQQVCIGAYEKQ